MLNSIYSPLLWFLSAFCVVSDSVLSLGNFLSLYVLTYFSCEAQKLGKLSWAICRDIVRGNVFCMPHRLCISRIMLCNNSKLIHFNSTYSHSAILSKIVITIFISNLSDNSSPHISTRSYIIKASTTRLYSLIKVLVHFNHKLNGLW